MQEDFDDALDNFFPHELTREYVTKHLIAKGTLKIESSTPTKVLPDFLFNISPVFILNNISFFFSLFV